MKMTFKLVTKLRTDLKARILLLTLTCLLFNFSAPGQGRTQPPDFDAERAAGIFSYDSDKVIKKLKISDSLTELKVSNALHNYNLRMEELSLNNASTFYQLEELFDSQVKIAMQRRDRNVMNGVKSEIQQVIPPIRKEVYAEEQVLNDTLSTYLTSDQNKKWLKYQSGKKPSSNF